jgi:hypothetical protein
MMKTAFGVRCAYDENERKKQQKASDIDLFSTSMHNNLRAIYLVILTSNYKKEKAVLLPPFSFFNNALV